MHSGWAAFSLVEADQLSEPTPGVDLVTKPAIVFAPAALDVQEDIALSARFLVLGVQILAPMEALAVDDVVIMVSTSSTFAASLPAPSLTIDQVSGPV